MNQEPFPIEQSQTSPGPRPFSEIPPLWLKIFQMTEGFFAQEAPRYSNVNTFIAILISTVIAASLGVIAQFTTTSFQNALLKNLYPGGIQESLMPSFGFGEIILLWITVLVITIVAFYFSAGLVYLAARLMGGSGSYGVQAYLFSLVSAPLGIVSGLLAIIPCLGPLVSLGFSIYALVLQVRAVKVVHNLTSGKAAGAVLLPIALLFVVLCCLYIIGVAVFLNMNRTF